ncbi:MAG: PP2C family protein-serine/threonine phosphatase [Brevinematia bacterium]
MVESEEIKILTPNKKFPTNIIGVASRKSILVNENVKTYEVVNELIKDDEIEFVIVSNSEGQVVNVIESKEILNVISMKFGYYIYGNKPIIKLAQRFTPNFITVDENKPVRSILPKLSKKRTKLVIANKNSIYGATNSEILHSVLLKIIEEDSRETGRLQNMIIDKSIHSSNIINFRTFTIPSLNAGGDFIFVEDLNDSQSIVVIADVSGKGTSASIVTSMMSLFFNDVISMSSSKLTADNIKKLIIDLNKIMIYYFNYEKYLTLTICLVDNRSKTLIIFNMGHQPTYIFNRNEMMIKKSLNIPIGITELSSEMINYDEIIFLGLKAFLFTDGVTDIKNNEGIEYGDKRIEAILNSYENIDEVYSYLSEDLTSFSEDEYQVDDISFIVFELK